MHIIHRLLADEFVVVCLLGRPVLRTIDPFSEQPVNETSVV